MGRKRKGREEKSGRGRRRKGRRIGENKGEKGKGGLTSVLGEGKIREV